MGHGQDCACPPFLRAMLASSRKPWVAGKTRADGAPTLGCLLTCFRIHFGVWCLKKIDSLLRKKVYYKNNPVWGWSQQVLEMPLQPML